MKNWIYQSFLLPIKSKNNSLNSAFCVFVFFFFLLLDSSILFTHLLYVTKPLERFRIIQLPVVQLVHFFFIYLPPNPSVNRYRLSAKKYLCSELGNGALHLKAPRPEVCADKSLSVRVQASRFNRE